MKAQGPDNSPKYFIADNSNSNSNSARFIWLAAGLLVCGSAGFAIYRFQLTTPEQKKTIPATSSKPNQSSAPEKAFADLRDAVNNGSFEDANEKENDLIKLGSRVVPLLTSELNKIEKSGAINVKVRQRVAWILGNIGGDSALDALMKSVASKDLPEVRGQALLGLSKIAGIKSLDAMRDLLINADAPADLRESAAMFLARREEPEGVGHLMDTLKRSDQLETISWIVKALGFTTHADAARPALMKIIKGHPSKVIRGEAVLSLVRMDTSGAMEDLELIMKEEQDFTVRQKVIKGLGEMNMNDSIKAFLLKCLREDLDQGVRAMSVARLSIKGAEELLPELERCLELEKMMYVRIKIVETIGQIGGKQAMRLLKKIAKKDPMLRIRKFAKSALKTLKGTKTKKLTGSEKPASVAPKSTDLKLDDF